MKPTLALTLSATLLAGPGAARAADAISPRYLELLKRIVEINSGTANAEGQDDVRAALVPEFEALGFRASTFPVGQGHKVLSLELPGSEPELLLLGHVDTVFRVDSTFQKFSSAEGHLDGPGVIDMKGGLVLMLNALADLRAKDPQLLKKIRVAVNDDEETGSVFSRDKLKELGRGLHSGLVFEPGLPDGGLVTAHSGVHWLELKVRGKAAHAGLEHDKGINACVELAHKLARISELTDYTRHLTVNVGLVSGGTATNVVCEEASAKIDIRYVEQADLDHALGTVEKIVRSSTVKNPLTGDPTSAETKVLVHIPSMPERFSKALLASAQAAAASVGQKANGRWVGYASDANGLATIGMNLLVGLGPYGSGMHTEHEQMVERSYGERLKLSTALIRKILSEPQPPLN